MVILFKLVLFLGMLLSQVKKQEAFWGGGKYVFWTLFAIDFEGFSMWLYVVGTRICKGYDI